MLSWLLISTQRIPHSSCQMKKVLFTAEGIILAKEDGIDWILHIDTDELVYPGGASHYSIQRLLADVPEDVDTLVFPNYESLPETDNVVSPFEEVSLPSPDVHSSDLTKLDACETCGNDSLETLKPSGIDVRAAKLKYW